MSRIRLKHLCKDILVYISVVAIVFTMFNIIPTLADSPKIWNGKKNVSSLKYDGGDGTEDNPFLISDGSQLYKMVSESKEEKGKQYFKLTDDIWLNDIRKENWTKSPKKWFTADTNQYYFGSVFDGAGHTIYGVYINASGSGGLIPSLSAGAIIGNLTISDANITTTYGHCGALTGGIRENRSNNTVKIVSCAVVNSRVSGMGATMTSAGFAGKVVGPVSIENCFVGNCDITHSGAKTDVAAFTGDCWWPANISIKNSISIGLYPAAPYKEGNDEFVKCKNVFTDTEPTKSAQAAVTGINVVENELLIGEKAKDTLEKFDFVNRWKLTDSYPEIIKKEGGLSDYDETMPGDVWSGMVSKNYNGGTGTADDPYLISTAGQLALLVKSCVDGEAHKNEYFELTDNIILNDTTEENWKEEANQWYFTTQMQYGFGGHFNGNGHIVSGLYIENKNLSYIYAALFPTVNVGSVIENVGLVNSEISLNKENYETVAGGIVGSVSAVKAEAGEVDYAMVSQCFADSTVKLSGYATGGIVCYGARTTEVNNCFFTGTVDAKRENLGAIVGFNWSWDGIRVNNCYAATQVPKGIIGAADSNQTSYRNCYSLAYQDNSGVRTLYYTSKMNGDAAKKNMDGLDFDKIWITRENETPGLRIFEENRDLYSNKHDFDIIDETRYVAISFVTYTDTEIDTLYTTELNEFELPEPPKREGYKFMGWCTDDTLSMIYPSIYAPVYDITLYAKWELLGSEETFENYPDTEYDRGEDYELYKMGMSNFSIDYVHSGLKSLHRIGEIQEDQDFLLFYENELQIGKIYTMTFWATTDETAATVEASVVHSTWPDIDEPNVGVGRRFKLNLKNGLWKKYICTFTAQSKWISIRLSGGHSVFFDDFVLYTNGKNGTLYNIKPSNIGETNNESLPLDDTVIEDITDDSLSFDDTEIEDITEDNSESNDELTTEPEQNKEQSGVKDEDDVSDSIQKETENKAPSKDKTQKNIYILLYVIIGIFVVFITVFAIKLFMLKKKKQ